MADAVAALTPISASSIDIRRVVAADARRRVGAAAPDAVSPDGTVFIPFTYHEAAANLLPNPALDPTAKLPELKFCAVRVQRG